MHSHSVSPSGSQIQLFACHELGCKSQPFKRIADLNRHKRKHGSLQRFDCPASDCERTGKRGFSRADKLADHTLAGHSESDWFSCAVCEVLLIRAEYEVHLMGMGNQENSSAHLRPRAYRTCPMPRCSFKVHLGSVRIPRSTQMDLLQQHLLEKHDLQARSHFSEVLEQRGFDTRSGEIICPLCPSSCRFQKCGDFEDHFMRVHFRGPVCGRHGADRCEAMCLWRSSVNRISVCTSVPDEVRQHRLTILRIWPLFAYYPVWDDIKRCTRRAWPRFLGRKIGSRRMVS